MTFWRSVLIRVFGVGVKGGVIRYVMKVRSCWNWCRGWGPGTRGAAEEIGAWMCVADVNRLVAGYTASLAPRFKHLILETGPHLCGSWTRSQKSRIGQFKTVKQQTLLLLTLGLSMAHPCTT